MVFFLDILALVIIAFCVWMGYRKGFILSLSGVIVIVLSIVLGSMISKSIAPKIADSIEPYIGWISEDAVDEAIRDVGSRPEVNNEDGVFEVSVKTFENMGFSSDAAQNMTKIVWEYVEDGAKSVKEAISRAFTSAITYLLIYIVIFAIIALILSTLANLVNSFFSLPGLSALNKIGGIALGAVYGIAIVFVVYWFLRFLGFIIPQEELSKTFVTRFFMYVNPLKLILGI